MLCGSVNRRFQPEDCVLEFAGLLKGYRISHVTGDRYAGEWPQGAVSTFWDQVRGQRTIARVADAFELTRECRMLF